jgi:ABC-type Fe3+ transport system permease subunit
MNYKLLGLIICLLSGIVSSVGYFFIFKNMTMQQLELIVYSVLLMITIPFAIKAVRDLIKEGFDHWKV